MLQIVKYVIASDVLPVPMFSKTIFSHFTS